MGRRGCLMAGGGEMSLAKLGYVDGAALALDGIFNRREGHDANSDTWEDISGNGHDYLFTNFLSQWKNGNCFFSDNDNDANSGNDRRIIYDEKEFHSVGFNKGFSFEVVVKSLTSFTMENYAFMLDLYAPYHRLSIYWYGITNKIRYMLIKSGSGSAVDLSGSPYSNKIYAVTCVFLGRNVKFYFNGNLTKTDNFAADFEKINTVYINGSHAVKSSRLNELYSFRVYDRVLTDSEILHNHQIDKQRFIF